MSWSATLEVTRGHDKNAKVEVKHRQEQTGSGAAESKRALDETIRMVETLINLMVLGHGVFTVTLSGHANPGNSPVPGWSNDFVNISINQRNWFPPHRAALEGRAET